MIPLLSVKLDTWFKAPGVIKIINTRLDVSPKDLDRLTYKIRGSVQIISEVSSGSYSL